jgi:glycyl-tRNA synthetase
VGTPYCVTVDVQTVGDPTKREVGDGRVTVRNRDSMGQIRVPITELESVCAALLAGTAWTTIAERHPSQPSAPG